MLWLRIFHAKFSAAAHNADVAQLAECTGFVNPQRKLIAGSNPAISPIWYEHSLCLYNN